MNVVVSKVNNERALAIFYSETDGYGFFELLDFVKVEEDDELQGNFNIIGETSVINLNTGNRIKICIESYGMSFNNAMENVFGRKRR